MLNLHKIWIEQCEAARGIEDEFGVVPAMKYLVGEKFLNYLDAAERDADFRHSSPRSRKSSSRGKLPNILRKPVGRNHSIPACTTKMTRTTTQKRPRWNARSTSGVSQGRWS